MADMPNVRKVQRGLRVDLELDRKVLRKYAQKSDTDVKTAYIRALEDSTRDVRLTVSDYKAIAEQAEANRIKRENKKAR